MKIRNDFVANSSSSSFILGFKDESCIEFVLQKEYTGGHYDRILNDIREGLISKEDAINEFVNYIENWHWGETCRYVEKHIITDGTPIFDWLKNEDNEKKFKDIQTELNKNKILKFKKDIEEYNCFAQVEYSDHGYSDLEHEIMPNLNCTIRRFSYH